MQPKNAQEIEAMREGGAMLVAVLQELKQRVQPGMTTKDLADIARTKLESLGGKPAFLGYYGFPDVLCVSLNDEVVHGIPSEKRVIEDGDIVSMDFGVLHKGLITDAALSVIAGQPKDKADEKMLHATEAALNAAIDEVCDGVKVGTMGAAAQKHMEAAGLGIVRDFVGHGVGHQLHEEPNIPNYGLAGQGPMLHAGMTVAIEPMSTRGSYEVSTAKDGWTVRTRDGSRSAHFEKTVLVTTDGVEVLTPF